jgi:hypothetical protein
MQLLDVDMGRRTTIRTIPRAQDYDRLDVQVVDGELVVVGDNNTGAGTGPFPAHATTAGPGSSWREIGQASFLEQSSRPGRVWLVAENDTNRDPGSTVTEVDLTGRVHRQAHFPGQFGAQPFADGFLRDTVLADGTSGPDTELVDGTGRRLQLYPRTGLVTARGSTAVLEPARPCGPCRLTVLTAGSPPAVTRVTFPQLPYLLEAGLTQDARTLFTSNHEEGLDDRHGLLYSRITELDLTTARSRPVEEAWSATYYGPSFQFSPDGRWMFFIDADGRSIDAYDLHDRHAYRVRGSFDTITQLALL